MKFKKHSIISIILSVMLVFGSLTGLTVTSSAADVSSVSADVNSVSSNDYGLMDDVEGGLILHCWCWSFNTIKNNLEKIANAGYTAIQTSPISRCLAGDGGGMQLSGNGKWYYHYQPVEYTIGNYQLGTEAEFKEMCDAAHSYGIKVIVDVVANHCTGSYSSISDSIKNIQGGAFHNNGGSINYNSREEVTQNDLSGLKDNNTQNPNVQNMILSFLKQAVADGADGFRYDAAKHIELPDDDSSFASNFWPNVLNNGSSFQYGEILQDPSHPTARFSAYADYMHVTASSYGYILREAITKNNFSRTTLSNLSSEGVSKDRLVAWVESHDTYANGGKSNDNNTSFWIDNQQIRLGWAVLAAQGGMSGLFFSRPDGSSPSNVWGNNLIGPAGDSNYYNDEVVAVNHFHNAMNGLSSSMENVNGDKSVLIINRESSGVVIVNSSNSDVTLNNSTSLASGTYVDEAHGRSFTSANGKLTGTVKAGQIAVIYKDNTVHKPSVSISFNGTNQGGNFFGTATVTLNSAYTTSTTYKLGSAAAVPYYKGDTITFGENMADGESITLTLYGTGTDGSTVEKSYVFTKLKHQQLKGTTCVYYDNSETNWDKVHVYVYNGISANRKWPGAEMTDLGGNIWGYEIFDSWEEAYVIFSNNGNNQNPTGEGFYIKKGESKIYSGSWMNYEDFINPVIPTNPQPSSTAPVPTTAPIPTTAPVPTTVPDTTTTVPPITTQQPTTEKTFKYGDVNLDGNININDVTLIQKHTAYMLTIGGLGATLSDVNSDGKINIKDATCIQKYIASITNGAGLVGKIYK